MSRLGALLNRGMIQLAAELLVIFILFTQGYTLLIEPALQSLAPTIYVESGLDWGRYSFPDTPTELTHMTLSLILIGLYYYWRFHYTKLGATVQETMREHVEN